MQCKEHKAGLVRRLKRAVTGDGGNATIEFVILFPAIMTIFLSAFEVGIFLTRTVMLDRGIDTSVRTLRLGRLNPATPEELKRQVCAGSMIISDCMNVMKIELTKVPTDTWALPAGNTSCVDRTEEIQPVLDENLELGQANDIMIVRACAVLDPFFGTTPLVMDMPLDASGGYQIISASTFVNEP